MDMDAPMAEVGSTCFFKRTDYIAIHKVFFLFEASEELPEVNKCLKCGITVLFATKASLANAGLCESFQLWTCNDTVTS